MPIDLGTDLGNLNQRDTTGTALNQHEYSARLDHRFSDSDTAYLCWSGQDNHRIGSAGRQNFSSFVDMTNLNVAANWVHTFDPTSIMQVSFATTDIKRETGNAFVGLPDGFISTVGWNPDFAGGFRGGTSYVPNVGVAQYFGGGERIGCTRTSDTWQYKGTYTKIVGTHTLKFGAEYNVIGHLGRTDDHANGFSTVGTASPDNPGGTGHPLASFLLNVPNRWSRRDFHKRARGGAMFSFFGQDSWKVTPRLTIDFGMRVDRTVLPQFGNPDPSSPFCDLGFLQVIDQKRFARLSPAHLALQFTHFVRLASGSGAGAGAAPPQPPARSRRRLRPVARPAGCRSGTRPPPAASS